jgi:hypothetical protein
VSLGPYGVFNGTGGLYLADWGSVARVDPQTDQLTPVAGTGVAGPLGDKGAAAKASMIPFQPLSGVLPGTTSVAQDTSGNLLIADQGYQRVRVVAASTGTFYGQAMTAGDIYTVAGDGQLGFSGDGGPATAADLSTPSGVAVDGAGNLVITDSGSSRIRVVAARTGTFYLQKMTAGHIYTVAGNGQSGFSGDSGPATAAELNGPLGVAVDASGNLVIADTFNMRIRVVAAHTGTFYGKAMTAGDIYTVAGNGLIAFSGDGGPGIKAELNNPYSVAVNGAGNLVIADTASQRIRELTPPASNG